MMQNRHAPQVEGSKLVNMTQVSCMAIKVYRAFRRSDICTAGEVRGMENSPPQYTICLAWGSGGGAAEAS